MVNVLTADSVLIQCDLGMMRVLMDDSILITSVLGVVNILTGDSVLIQCDLGMVSVPRIGYLLVRRSGCDEHPQV